MEIKTDLKYQKFQFQWLIGTKYKVILNENHLFCSVWGPLIDDVYYISKDFNEWLKEHKPVYRFTQHKGEGWLELRDRTLALECKLMFG